MHSPVKVAALVGLLTAVLALTGCGGGGSSSTTASSSSSSGGEASGSEAAGLSAAKAGIKPYVGEANPAFPVGEPLKEAPSPSSKLSQLQFGTPEGAIIAATMDAAAETAGVQLQTTKAGTSVSSIQSAAETILAQSPEAVLIPAAEPDAFANQLEEMVAKGIKLYSHGIMDPQKYGFSGYIFDRRQAGMIGKLMADWVVAKKGGSANIVFYETPELSFSAVEKESFEAQIGKICSGCVLRTAAVKAEEFGSTAPNTVVSDLQSHPETEEVVFASQEADVGLPAALKAAGIEVGMIGFAADPSTLEYIKNGEVEATLEIDNAVLVWTQFDMALRGVEGIPLTPGEKAGIIPMQFLTKKDITFDPSKGWTAYPEFVERFSKLWKVGP